MNVGVSFDLMPMTVCPTLASVTLVNKSFRTTDVDCELPDKNITDN